ncbi:PadR family transcriptional regulator [Cryobacterium adonitolivorans]|uniref:PadR family transcriptional regulator n=1 Tax=Cryobacterium adonitolivorans TaxID=1259189 RepID=UPI001F544645|nr:helix-turn-helix transcriptional regulator [Cryobacterium adonitolivorans]
MALEVDNDRRSRRLEASLSVRNSLLAILTMGPAYGFQLHGELGTRTAGRRTVNVGQIYSTLERLVRQGSVEAAGSTADGLPLYRLTDDGRDQALAWLLETDSDSGAEWNDMLDRVLIASSLPHIDLTPLLAGYRTVWLLLLNRGGDRGGAPGESGQERLVTAAHRLQARAALAWLDTVAAAADDAPTAGAPLLHRELSLLRPKRGRRPATSS